MDSLGGNAKTAMVICLAMDADNRSETLSTLNFGRRAKRIKCNAQVNFFGGELEELRRQNRLLLEQLDALTKQQSSSPRLGQSSAAGGGQDGSQSCDRCAALEEAEMAANDLKVKAGNLAHELAQANTELAALRATKLELEKYSADLLQQLNEAEARRQAQASLLQSNDAALVAGREALAAEEQRLDERLSAVQAREEEQEGRYRDWEQGLQAREQGLEERAAVASQQASYRQKAFADAKDGLRTDFAQAQSLQSQAEAMFSQLDANGDGILEPHELQHKLSDMGLSDGDIERLFILLDSDGDGTISREEFVLGYHVVKQTLAKARGQRAKALGGGGGGAGAGGADPEWEERQEEAEAQLERLQAAYRAKLDGLDLRDTALRQELAERQARLAESERSLTDRRAQFEEAAAAANAKWEMLAAADQQQAAQGLRLGAALQVAAHLVAPVPL